MNPKLIRFAALALILAGLALAGRATIKTVTLEIDGQSQEQLTAAFTVKQFLSLNKIPVAQADRISPPLDNWLSNGGHVTVDRAVPILIWDSGKVYHLISSERTPASLLAQVSRSLLPGDVIYAGSEVISPDQPLPLAAAYSLAIRRAVPITLNEAGQTLTFTSTQSSLGQALWDKGIVLRSADRLDPGLDTPLNPLSEPLAASLQRSSELTIQTAQITLTTRSTALTVGEALDQSGFALQGLDYSIPPAASSIPANGRIRVVRVQEAVLIEQKPLPFENEFQPSSDIEIDQQKVIQAGEYGVNARRVRVRYEDGKETSRQVENEWVARKPKNRIVGYGTKIVMHTLSTPDGEIKYWRALNMWATSYHPSEVGGDVTASGMRLTKGIVAIDLRYIPFYTKMYVPGYGKALAGDTGSGVIGRWIDLGYDDSNYKSWHEWVTVYFLWPPPDNPVWIIP